MSRIGLQGIAGLLLPLLVGAGESPGQERARPPYFDAGSRQSTYNGPGREDPEPAGLTEVRIGFFGPNDPSHAEGGGIWLGVNLALEEANAEGGYRGLPFRVIQGWADSPWSNGAGLVVRMAYVDRVWAIIGGIDGPSTHLAETVIAKAQLTLMSPGSTDKTVNLANVPWMFSAVPGDHVLAPILGRRLLQEIGAGTFVVIASNHHDSHVFLAELEQYLATARRLPALRYTLDAGREPTRCQAGRASTSGGGDRRCRHERHRRYRHRADSRGIWRQNLRGTRGGPAPRD